MWPGHGQDGGVCGQDMAMYCPFDFVNGLLASGRLASDGSLAVKISAVTCVNVVCNI